MNIVWAHHFHVIECYNKPVLEVPIMTIESLIHYKNIINYFICVNLITDSAFFIDATVIFKVAMREWIEKMLSQRPLCTFNCLDVIK
jgi:hypothetical protein